MAAASGWGWGIYIFLSAFLCQRKRTLLVTDVVKVSRFAVVHERRLLPNSERVVPQQRT